jgi:hypothetical protein
LSSILFANRHAEAVDECLAASINRRVRMRMESGAGRHVDYASTTALTHNGKRSRGEVHDGNHHKAEQLVLAPVGKNRQVHTASVVDQQIDRVSRRRESPFDSLALTGIGEIGGQDFDLRSGELSKFDCKRLESISAARHEHQSGVIGGQPARDALADTARSSCYERSVPSK